jgi:hypothetical protein
VVGCAAIPTCTAELSQASLFVGPLGASDSTLSAAPSRLHLESSLPDETSCESGMIEAGELSGLSAGGSLQSIIRGAVSRFAE